MSELPPADWYPDPDDPSQQRYWDGTQWTEHRAPGAQPAAPAAPSAPQGQWGQPQQPAQPAAWGAAGGMPQGPAPSTWLWQSIVATLLCCLPFGVAGIVFASQANTAVGQGDYVTAREKAAKAKTWTLVSVGVGLLVLVGYVIFVVVAIANDPNF